MQSFKQNSDVFVQNSAAKGTYFLFIYYFTYLFVTYLITYARGVQSCVPGHCGD
jgi:hypothetical protein